MKWQEPDRAQVHGIFDRFVVLEDNNGVGRISLHRLLDMAHNAAQRDIGKASDGNGRHYDRDSLLFAAETARTIGLVELHPCDISGCDRPGTEPMGNGVTFCAECCSAATPFDDKD